MNLADRIARLEAKLRPAEHSNTPVFMVTLDRGDPSQPFSIEHDGETWTQAPHEPLDQFNARARAAALSKFRPTGKHPVLFLVAKRPPLTREQWIKKWGPSGAEMADVD